MRLDERLAAVSAEAKRIRESLTFLNPKEGADPGTGLERGDRLIASRNTPEWNRRVMEAAMIITECLKGTRPEWHLREAMTTSDFPLLMGDVMYRQLLGHFQPWPVTYPSYFKIYETKDFRTLNLYTLDGGEGLLSTVKEREPYPEVTFTEAKKGIAVVKHGKRYPISFEMIINDDLGAFNDRPAVMASSCRNSEEYLATTMVFDANGPHASFFSVGNANIITGNPVLSIAALQLAFKVLSKMKNSDGIPILIKAVTLLVPPALEIVAQNIMNAIQIRLMGAEGGATANQNLDVVNWMKGRVRLEVNPYIPIVAATANGDTSWALIASTQDPSQRPAFMFAFMRGRRTPQLFIKDGNQRQVGGGEVSPLEGDFDTDSIDYKVRHIYGAAQGEPKMAVASNGSGS